MMQSVNRTLLMTLLFTSIVAQTFIYTRYQLSDHLGRNIDLDHPTLAVAGDVLTPTQCGFKCSLHDLCQSWVLLREENKCKLYEISSASLGNAYMLNLAVPHLSAVYMEVGGTYEPPTVPFQEPVCTSSCSELSVDCAFRHADGSYVIVSGDNYYKYSDSTMLCVHETEGPAALTDLITGVDGKPEMTASTDMGQTLFVFKSAEVFCYQYDATSGTYIPCSSWSVRTIQYQFGANMKDGGKCFLAFNHTYGVEFKGSDIHYSNGHSFKDEDNVPDNIFYNFPGSTDACVETHDAEVYILFEGSKIHVYNINMRSFTEVGSVCKT